MNDWLWAGLMTAGAFGAYHQLSTAWFLHQCRKRRRAELRGLRLVVSNRRSNAHRSF